MDEALLSQSQAGVATSMASTSSDEMSPTMSDYGTMSKKKGIAKLVRATSAPATGLQVNFAVDVDEELEAEDARAASFIVAELDGREGYFITEGDLADSQDFGGADGDKESSGGESILKGMQRAESQTWKRPDEETSAIITYISALEFEWRHTVSYWISFCFIEGKYATTRLVLPS